MQISPIFWKSCEQPVGDVRHTHTTFFRHPEERKRRRVLGDRREDGDGLAKGWGKIPHRGNRKGLGNRGQGDKIDVLSCMVNLFSLIPNP